MLYSERRLGHSIRLTLSWPLRITRPLACLLLPAPLRTRPASSTGGDPPAIRHINRRTRPEVCLYLPSCRRTHPAPCIRSPLALTRLLCGLSAALLPTDWLLLLLLPSTPGLRARTAVLRLVPLLVAGYSHSARVFLLSWPPRSFLGNVQAHPQRHQPKHHDRPPMPIVPQHPPVASRHSASPARPSTHKSVRQLRASS